jgi:hypothetical protein
VLQLADIEVGNPVEIPDIAGGKRRPCHQGSRRNKTIQSLDPMITVSVVKSASILAAS